MGNGELVPAGTEFQFCKMRFWRGTVVTAAQHREGASCHCAAHLKMVKMANSVTLYHNYIFKKRHKDIIQRY